MSTPVLKSSCKIALKRHGSAGAESIVDAADSKYAKKLQLKKRSSLMDSRDLASKLSSMNKKAYQEDAEQ